MTFYDILFTKCEPMEESWMGFFKDFKDDLSEAVNDLATENENETVEQPLDDDVMVNTLDDPELAQMAAEYKKEVDNNDANQEQTKNHGLNLDEAENKERDNSKLIDNNDEDDDMTENNMNDMLEEALDTIDEKVDAADVADVTDTTDDEEEIVDETAIITLGLSVAGNLDSKGSIDIFGNVTGDVTCRGKLTVSGSITGSSKANEVFVNNAQIDGNIEAKGSVKVGQGTVIVGNVSATSAVIAGAVKGDIDVHGPVIVDSTAIIVGDIKSKSVQINNGATIDGRCSQCYADGNPASIFDHKINK